MTRRLRVGCLTYCSSIFIISDVCGANVDICGIDHYNLNTALRLQITAMANSQVAVQAFKLNTGDSIPALGLGQFDWLRALSLSLSLVQPLNAD
jgi:hypothetical protein